MLRITQKRFHQTLYKGTLGVRWYCGTAKLYTITGNGSGRNSVMAYVGDNALITATGANVEIGADQDAEVNASHKAGGSVNAVEVSSASMESKAYAIPRPVWEAAPRSGHCRVM